MKVFHLITHFDLGGAERVAASIAESRTNGMEYHVVEIMRGHSAYTKKFMSELSACGVRIHRSLMPDINWHFLMQRVAAIFFPLRLLYIMLRWQPDVIHTHTETPDLALWVGRMMLPACLFRNVRIVRTIHNTRLWTGLPNVAPKVERMFCDGYSNVAISDAVRDAYANRFGAIAPIVHNGVAKVEQHPYPELPQGRIKILFAGRLEPQKGVSVLCDVMRMLASDNRYFLVVAGDGSLRQLVEQTIAEGCGDIKPLPNVRLVEPVFGLAGYMSSFDYLFMPSVFEGLSMLSMEASINSLPVIANDAPGLGDTLPQGWPLMVHDNSIEEYREIFKSVIPSADREKLVETAAAFVEKHFSVRAMQLAYERIYKGSSRAQG